MRYNRRRMQQPQAHRPVPSRGVLGRLFLEPLDDLMAAMETQIMRAPHPQRALVLLVVGGVVSWWVYVPIHELLHAVGCWLTGGTVSELQIAPEYGGALFARLFPFVVSGGDYAGRLSGFDIKGSDWIYLATDALPFLLTVFIGVPLLKACARGQRAALFGAAFVLGMAPFYCITGDYYEMGSILTTRALTWLSGGGEPVAFANLRSDDVLKLVGELWAASAELHAGAVSGVVVATALVVSTLLAFATYAAGARLVKRR